MRRRWLLIAGAGTLGLLLMGFLGVLLLYPQLGEWAVRNRVLPRLEARLGRAVDAERITVTRGAAVIEGLEVAGLQEGDPPLVRVERLQVKFDFWRTWLGEIELARALVRGVHVHAERRPDGSDDLEHLVERLGLRKRDGADDGGPRGGRLGRLRPDIVLVRDASVEFVDRAAGVSVQLGHIDTELPRSGGIEVRMRDVAGSTSFGPHASAESVRLTTELEDPVGRARMQVVGGALSATTDVSLSTISGSIENIDTPGALRVALQGSYGGSSEVLWHASGELTPAQRMGAIRVEAERFALARLASVLEGSALMDIDDTEVGARMDLSLERGVVGFKGGFELADANIYHPMLAEKPVRDIALSAEVDGTLDLAARIVDIDRADVQSRGVRYLTKLLVALPGGREPTTGVRREQPRVEARLEIPPVHCQKMLEGIPRELVPYLSRFKLDGRFRTNLQVAIDWTDLDATTLDGYVGIHRCQVVREPLGKYSLERLLESFTHYVEVGVDQWIEFIVGPENPDFAPIWDISPHLINSLMTTEDSRFYEHDGFIVREFKSALIRNLKAGYFRYGASSITMQMVKNVVLYREKTLSRKLQELFFTWHLENKLDKDRIMEIYVNAIEFGPGIYGIGPAARHYFGKHPRDLNPVESAFFSSILPNPKKRYQQYCDNKLWRWADKKIARIIKLMHKRERLTDEEYEAAKSLQLVFDRQEAPSRWECRRMVKEAIENARPTNPQKR